MRAAVLTAINDTDSLVSRTYPLEEVNTAFGDMRNGALGRGVIVFD